MIQEVKEKINEIGIKNFPLDFLEWFKLNFMKPDKIKTYKDLFNYMADEHNVVLTIDEMHEIIIIAKKEL